MISRFHFILFFFIATNILGSENSFKIDSLKQLTEKECVKGSLTLFSTSNDLAFYKLGIKTIDNSQNDYSFNKSLLYVRRAFLFYDTNIDSVNYYLDHVDLSIEPDSSFTLQYEYNRTVGLSSVFHGKYPEASEAFYKNIKLTQDFQDKEKLHTAYSDAAIPHYYAENFTEAIKFWKLSSSTAYSIGDFNSVYGSYLNVALASSQNDEIDSAKLYKNKCFELSKNKELNTDKATLHLNMGVIEFNIEDYNEAIIQFQKSSDYALELDDLSTYAKAISNISSCYIEQGNPEKSIDFLKEALYKTDNIDPKFKSSLYKLMSDAYSGVSQYQSAFLFLDSAFVLKQKILNENTTEQIADMQEKYKSVEKDKKIAETELAYNIEKTAKEKEQLESAIQKRQNNYLFIGLGLVALFGAFMYNRYRITRKQKRIIENQKLEADFQKQKIEQQHFALEESHNEISDSIKYAERLQMAILPSQEDLNNNLGDGFVFFKPKDVVSGDFYWSTKVNDTIYFAAADCTGHGVPGALVSVVCSNALNRSVKEFALDKTSDILNKSRELVIETFARSGQNVMDGMDIALCSIKNGVLSFSGAYNPLWIVRKNNLLTSEEAKDISTLSIGDTSIFEIKSDRQPIGPYALMKDFTMTQVEILSGDSIYIFTDGYADQFGGSKGKKMKQKLFKKKLLEIQGLSMSKQQQYLSDFFDDWKGNIEQIDDICVIGVRF